MDVEETRRGIESTLESIRLITRRKFKIPGSNEALAGQAKGNHLSPPRASEMASAFGLTLGSRIIERGLTFLALVVVIRLLPPAGAGSFVLMIKVSGLVAIVATLGVPAAAVRLVSDALGQRDGMRVADLLHAFLVSRVLLAFTLTAIGVIASPWLADVILHAPTQTAALTLGIVAAASNGLLGFNLSQLQAYRNFGRYALLNGLTTAVKVCLTVVFVFTAFSPVLVMVPWAIVPALGACAGLVLFPLPGVTRAEWLPGVRRGTRELAGFSGWLGIAGLATAIAANVDVPFLARTAGISTVAAYGAATNIALAVTVIGGALYTVLLPWVSRIRNRGQLRRFFWVTLAGGAAATAPTLVLTMLIGPTLMRLVYGPAFVAATPILIVLLAASLIGLVVICSGLSFLAANRPAALAAAAIGQVVTAVIGLSILSPRYGGMGTAVAILLSQGAGLLVTLLAGAILFLRSPDASRRAGT